ncbi:unannotated protein [freshwater metagenome]|uniref:Unannotated protein n=1 Tax=freshwater metagenome TaxID=449393 RepID=A0A6J6L0G8_9ZZZZ
MHAVEEAQIGGLAATRWPNEAGHCACRKLERDAGKRVMATEPCVSIPSFEAGKTRLGGWL